MGADTGLELLHYIPKKGYKKDIFAVLLTGLKLSHLNHAIGVYIIKDKVFVYHQHEVLYIIIAKPRYTLARDDIQPSSGADDMHRTPHGDDIPLLRNG